MRNCLILNNYSYQVSHGFTLITSTLHVKGTKISIKDHERDLFTKLSIIDSLETGVFNLHLASSIYISDLTEISGLFSSRHSVLFASDDSNVYTSNNVTISNCQASFAGGQTFMLQNTKEISIKDVLFKGNKQVNIRLAFGSVEIINSIFIEG